MKLNWAKIRTNNPPSDVPVAFSSDLEAENILAAYRNGFYPFPTSTLEETLINEIRYGPDVACGKIKIDTRPSPYSTAWMSPNPRPVVDLRTGHLGKNIKNRHKKSGWHSTVNKIFSKVVSTCAECRTVSWITLPLQESLSKLHSEGIYYSVEVWDGDHLVGGAFGIQMGAISAPIPSSP